MTPEQHAAQLLAFCPECGPVRHTDEDDCCARCGSTALVYSKGPAWAALNSRFALAMADAKREAFEEAADCLEANADYSPEFVAGLIRALAHPRVTAEPHSKSEDRRIAIQVGGKCERCEQCNGEIVDQAVAPSLRQWINCPACGLLRLM